MPGGRRTGEVVPGRDPITALGHHVELGHHPVVFVIEHMAVDHEHAEVVGEPRGDLDRLPRIEAPGVFEPALPGWRAPAIAQQKDMLDSDIDRTRKHERPEGLRYAWREMIRGYYEVRRLPSQMRELLTQRATFTPMSFR